MSPARFPWRPWPGLPLCAMCTFEQLRAYLHPPLPTHTCRNAQVFMGPPSSPSPGYRKVFNSLPSRVCPTGVEDTAARAAVDRVVRVLQEQLPQASRVNPRHTTPNSVKHACACPALTLKT